MGERRFRLVDGAAGTFWVLSTWMVVRGGLGDPNAWHIWGLAVGGLAIVVTIWAIATCVADRVVDRVSRRVERRLAERLPALLGDTVVEAMREVAFDELAGRRPGKRAA